MRVSPLLGDVHHLTLHVQMAIGLSGSTMERATFLLRRMFLSFTRPLAELTRICDPSRSNQTGVT